MPEFKAPLVPDAYYHIFNRSVGKEKMFVVEDNYHYFLGLFKKYIVPVSDIFSWSLLPNHFHFFIRTRDTVSLDRRMESLDYSQKKGDDYPDFLLQQFSNCFNAYTKALNKQQNRKGKLFVEPFCRKAILSPLDYRPLTHFIHSNPVLHGYCKTVDSWLFSSYHDIIHKKNSWSSPEEVIKWFGSVEAFIEFHKQPVFRKFYPLQ